MSPLPSSCVGLSQSGPHDGVGVAVVVVAVPDLLEVVEVPVLLEEDEELLLLLLLDDEPVLVVLEGPVCVVVVPG